jgi:hypothetical protein
LNDIEKAERNLDISGLVKMGLETVEEKEFVYP